MTEDLFTNRKPDDLQAADLDEITAAFNDIHRLLDGLLPKSRYASLAITNLEQASMWAKKAVLFS